MLTNVFQLADHVIGEVSDRSGSERRQPRNGCRAVLAQQTLDDLKDVAVNRLTLAATRNLDFPLGGPYPHVWRGPEEGVPSDLLAAFDRLQ
jgi:hypothetical protein